MALESSVYLGKFVFDAAVADLESLDFAEPAFAFRLDDAGLKIVADLLQSGSLRWFGPQQ